MDAVSGLMLERQRFEGWIAALEQKRSITPPHVYERVRGDYEVRLKEVVQKLVGRTTELKEMVAALTARMAKLQTDENAKRDERYEAELRATVGEFESDKWEKLRGSIDETIARLATERAGVSAELARVQQILSMAGAIAGAPIATEAPRGTEAPRAEPPRPRASEPASTAPPSAGVGRPQAGRFDELAFLSSVVESAPGGNGAGHPESGKHSAQPAPAVTNVAPPAAAPPPAAVRPPSGRQPVQPAPVPTAATPRAPTGSNHTVVTRPENSGDGAVPSYLRDVPTETAKSLKCQECGTMNFPTEWYCERCGGELAAM